MLCSIKGEEKKYQTKKDVEFLLPKLTETIVELDLSTNVFEPEAMEEICSKICKMKNLQIIRLDAIFSTLKRQDMLKCLSLICNALIDKRLIELDLSNNALSCEFPEEFYNLIKNLRTLKFLKIRNGGIGLKGGNLLGEMIEHLINLEYLDIAQNRFFSFPEKLSNGLLKLNNLSILKLEYNTIEKDSLELFLEKLKNKPIEFLDITDNILSVKGCKYLGELFNSWNLKELRMGDCLARNEGIIEFLKYANKKYVPLNLPGGFDNEIDFTLDISYNEWDQECMDDLVNFCEKYKIKQINISGNFYDDDEPITNVCDKYGGQVILEEDDESIEGFSGLETITEMVKNL